MATTTEFNKAGQRTAVTTFQWSKVIYPGLFFIVLLTVLLMFSALQPPTSLATLVVQDGEVTVEKDVNTLLIFSSTQVRTLKTGDALTVTAGDSVMVGAGASATLQLYEGSTVELMPDTRLNLAELTTTADQYRVRIDLQSGEIINQVKRLIGADDRYEVITPSSAVSVRGTVFRVKVIDEDSSMIACDEGLVDVNLDGWGKVDVRPGEYVMAVRGKEPVSLPQSGDSAPTEPESASPPEVVPTSVPTLTPTPTPTVEPASDNVVSQPTSRPAISTPLPTSTEIPPTSTLAPTPTFTPVPPTPIPTEPPPDCLANPDDPRC